MTTAIEGRMSTDEFRMLYAGAVNYADAVLIVHSHSASKGRDGLILPTHTLIGLTIELLFKAVYLRRGGEPKDLKKPKVRHNLVALQGLVLKQGFTSSIPQIAQIVNIIGDNYAAHEYRYMKSNTTLHYVELDGTVPAIQSFVDEVARELGLPIRRQPK